MQTKRDIIITCRRLEYQSTSESRKNQQSSFMSLCYLLQNITNILQHSSLLFLLSSIKVEERIGFAQIFDFRFLMDLHALGCPEHDLTIFGQCLSVCVSLCV